MSLIGELKRRHVFKVAAAYAVVSWVLVQITNVIIGPLSLPEWFETVVLAFLILGFPIAIVFAWAFDLSPAAEPQLTSDATLAPERRSGIVPMASGAMIAVAVLIVGGLVYWYEGGDERNARTEGLQKLGALIAASEWESAYQQARTLEQLIPNDPTLRIEWPKLSWRSSLITDPAGARIYRREYGQSDDEWEYLGTSPINETRVPFGMSVLRANLEGYEPVYQLIGGSLQITEELTPENFRSKVFDLAPDVMRLDPAGHVPEGTVRVPGWSVQIDGQQVEMEDFFLDRFEVTNEQYKAFVDSGGYEKPQYWEDIIVIEGAETAWEDAMEIFVDRTRQRGPSNWSAGDYPEGRADHPVSGVSWYEAMAYARFAGQSLPTVYHWRRAYALGALAWMIPQSNLGGSSTEPIGSNRGISWVGNYDMAGNVREWTLNNVGGQRYILGGAWNDEKYRAEAEQFAQAPDNRGAGNGFRLAIVRDTPATMNLTRASVQAPDERDIESIGPVSDDVFNAYRMLFDYEPTPLNVTLESQDSNRVMAHEYVEVEAPYTGSRLPIHIYLPKSASPPYQVVIYWPGSIVLRLLKYEDFKFQFEFLLKSGRAVAFPIYDGTFGRDATGRGRQVIDTSSFREILTRTVKDLRRTVDYLESRPDIDSDRIAFFGNSMGAYRGAIGVAVDKRFDAAIFYTLALLEENPPDIDPLTYLPYVTLPTLMLSGEYDPIAPLDTAARPTFDRIGQSPEMKRLVVAPGGHFVPHDVLVGESLSWLDKHLGTANRN